jgi:hypothetical protein
MSVSTKKSQQNGGAAQLADFVRRASNAAIHTAEPGSGGSQDDAWEVVDGEAAKEAEDKEEWVVVGKTEDKKKKQG